MGKLYSLIILTLTLGMIISGCSLTPSATNTNMTPVVIPTNQNINVPVTTTISYLTSADDFTKYCNGGDMNGAGYKKSLTEVKTLTIPGTNLSQTELIKQTVIAASNAANLSDITLSDPNFLKISGNTAYIEPIDGWAGVSIFLCAWQPLVEVNILQFPEIKKVEWVADELKWKELAE
jgi:hypothetical protein